jgi:hypothetical protein
MDFKVGDREYIPGGKVKKVPESTQFILGMEDVSFEQYTFSTSSLQIPQPWLSLPSNSTLLPCPGQYGR